MKFVLIASIVFSSATAIMAGVGDPQTMTDHIWYPGELSCSTFERLFRTEDALYTHVTGRKTDNDEDKALAAWYWRNINFYHCTVAGEDLGSDGWKSKTDKDVRDFWSGQFANGFGVCFTSHHQFCAEIQKLLGPNRSRSCGIDGHTSHEVWLTGGAYGDGKWALLDHDISTVIFSSDGSRLLGLSEVAGSKYGPAAKTTDVSRGWLPNGLYGGDSIFNDSRFVGYSTGYAGVEPLVNLRSGETLRRYVNPGQEDGKTFAWWGGNRNAGMPGPFRGETWVNQPQNMFKVGKRADGGNARYGNAVYAYTPDFASGKYKEAVTDENDDHVTFEWYSPYIVAAFPAADKIKKEFGIYEDGCTGGLTITGKVACPVEISLDQGKTWTKSDGKDGLDLTDAAKGHRQYFLKFDASARDLAASGLRITTVCQCGQTIVPHVTAGANKVTYESSGHGFIAAGPNKAQAAAHLVAGAMNSPTATLELAAPRSAKAVHVYAAGRASCGDPPKPAKYNIDWSADGGKTWQAVVKDWEIVRHPPEPDDWWGQTFCWGDVAIAPTAGPIQIRFSNTASRPYMRVQAELAYAVDNTSPLKVTYAWREGKEVKTATHIYAQSEPGKTDASWFFTTGDKAESLYVEYAAQ